MALLSKTIRTLAITGDSDRVNAWFADRQRKLWAGRTFRPAFPRGHPAAPAPSPEALRTLEDLHARGAVTDAEYERLRALSPGQCTRERDDQRAERH